MNEKNTFDTTNPVTSEVPAGEEHNVAPIEKVEAPKAEPVDCEPIAPKTERAVCSAAAKNEVIIDNQHKAGTAITLNFNAIGRIYKMMSAFNEKKKAIMENTVYSQEYRDEMLKKESDRTVAAIRSEIPGIEKNDNDIVAAAAVMENVLELDAELSNAVQLISSMGNDMAPATRDIIVSKFHGMPAAIKVLAGAFKKVGVDPTYYCKSHMFSSEELRSSLTDLEAGLYSCKPGSMFTAYNMAAALDDISKKLGADNKKTSKDLDGAHEGFTEALYRAAGLTNH